MNLGETYVLDGIDRQLLDELQSDCKRSLKEIGAAVGLSAPSVMERVRKLESAGIIRGYHALLDARKVGLDISAFIGVSISDPQLLSAFEERVDSIPPTPRDERGPAPITTADTIPCPPGRGT